jgi:hypothetical protein
MLGLAVAAWLAGFAILLRLGTWTSFAITGGALSALTLWIDPGARDLLRASARAAMLGLAARSRDGPRDTSGLRARHVAPSGHETR